MIVNLNTPRTFFSKGIDILPPGSLKYICLVVLNLGFSKTKPKER